MHKKQWETYEEVATYLLGQFADSFGVGKFEGKQIVAGENGANWEIDAKGCSEGDDKFLIVECKLHTKNGISQAITGSLAWTIKESGASGGILVSPVGLQKGAKIVAKSANVIEVILTPDSTTTDYFMKFLTTVCMGFSDNVNVNLCETLTITRIDKDGNDLDSKTFQN